ncbi:hypothetical protein IWW34DRAFT_793658 [Fusarium oxysporum f. sp. albedinis]|nr:hypothetical protein FOMA001_g2030 [Fusarium oxysporum f. sp. matthiolae]KAI3574483.1 hypothetical protein IWW34DRAFT_793658 [Fusarium oxysporum f. sp. albedinis]KAK2488264.1 hypothetical protein H9L39_02191 [Fusarium oxysporum f. sp. albedinis]
MGNKYTIRINNNTGSDQNYNLLSEKPEISGVSKSNIWTNVHQSNESCTDGATAEFEVWKTYHGIVGTWRGGAMDGGRVKIVQTKAVNLGSQSPDGSQIPGTTLNMVVVNGEVPSFGRAPADESAFVNAFEIDTGNDFTLEMATDNNFFIGVAGSPDGASSAPIATFRPEPGSQYQIHPSNVFFISVGQSMQVGQLVDVARMRNTLRIDFANSGPNVTVNHTPNGQLAIAR